MACLDCDSPYHARCPFIPDAVPPAALSRWFTVEASRLYALLAGSSPMRSEVSPDRDAPGAQ